MYSSTLHTNREYENVTEIPSLFYIYIFVPETCVPYLSDSCSFPKCSVSTAVCRGEDCAPPPFLFCLVDFILYPYFTNPPQDGAHGKST